MNPVLAIAITVAAYAGALALHGRWRVAPPILVATAPIIAILLAFRIPFAEYDRGGGLLSWWLGPATVALAVPMYRHGLALRRSLARLAIVVFAGAVVGMITAGATAWLLGAPRSVVASTIPKSVTTPIAIEICRQLGGIPQLTIALVILAGVLGASFGTGLLLMVGVSDDRAIGAAIGSASHGIGTASLVRQSDMRASVSAWAMAAAGVFTSLLAAGLALVWR